MSSTEIFIFLLKFNGSSLQLPQQYCVICFSIMPKQILMGTPKLLEIHHGVLPIWFTGAQVLLDLFTEILKFIQVRLLVGVLKCVGTGDLKIPDGGASFSFISFG